ncbi:MAG: RNA polymerase sigma factor [Lysobacterales bacterium]
MLPADDLERIQTVLKRAVDRLCYRWGEHEREDLVQTALLKLHQRTSGEDNTPVLASYLYRVAHSIVVDEVRKRSRRPVTTDAISPEQFGSERNDSPDAALAADDARQALWDCLGQLADSRRQALVLYLQGHTVPEAAEMLDWPNKRTENCVYRGLANLRECLNRKGVDHVLG